MKKLFFAALLLAVLAAGAPLFAQTISAKNSSEYYYVNVPLEKIYPSKLGYIIQYRKGVNELGRIAIPNEWFTFAGGKAELIKLPHGKNWPTLSTLLPRQSALLRQFPPGPLRLFPTIPLKQALPDCRPLPVQSP